MTENEKRKNWEKKSERFEVRLPFSKKQAFSEACEQQGDTPSSAVRRFIDAYLRRNDRDNLAMAGTALKNIMFRDKRVLITIGVLAAITFSVLQLDRSIDAKFVDKAQIVCAKTGIHKVDTKGLFRSRVDCRIPLAEAPPPESHVFELYDKNGNGVLNLGEISPNDLDVHRVLDIDGVLGISKLEFFIKGQMEWSFVEENSVDVSIDGNMPQSTVRGEQSPPTLVVFNLGNPTSPTINVWKEDPKNPNIGRQPDRVVLWAAGKSVPELVFSNHEFRARTTAPND